jgi:hypothetical protein
MIRTIWNGEDAPDLCVNRGDRPTVMRGDGGDVEVPAGHGLLMTLRGPRVLRPGDVVVEAPGGARRIDTKRRRRVDVTAGR